MFDSPDKTMGQPFRLVAATIPYEISAEPLITIYKNKFDRNHIYIW